MTVTTDGYAQACEVEKLAEAALLPYMEKAWPNCTYYPTRHHRLIQKVCGDLLVSRAGRAKYIEIKAERENKHGNFFIEVWSNKSRHTLGWFHACQADWLWYYFLAERALYLWAMQDLRDWARGPSSRCASDCRLYDFPERKQNRYEQLNDTWGRCVPIGVLTSVLPSFCGPITIP